MLREPRKTQNPAWKGAFSPFKLLNHHPSKNHLTSWLKNLLSVVLEGNMNRVTYAVEDLQLLPSWSVSVDSWSRFCGIGTEWKASAARRFFVLNCGHDLSFSFSISSLFSSKNGLRGGRDYDKRWPGSIQLFPTTIKK